MTTTAPPPQLDTTPERVLLMAFELREQPWALGFTTGPGHKPRERPVAARHQARVLQRKHPGQTALWFACKRAGGPL
jgi:hypothetical protein